MRDCTSWRRNGRSDGGHPQPDFTDTLTFYPIWNRNRLWPLSYLRTTSLLNATNRTIRRRLRCAPAYHSRTGLQAMLAKCSFKHEFPPPGYTTLRDRVLISQLLSLY